MKKVLLFLGDALVFFSALFLTLIIRYPYGEHQLLFQQHLIPFSILFGIWLIIFYSHDLYDISFSKNNLEFYSALIRTVVLASILSIVFFYLTPQIGIAPRRNLFIFIAVFSILFYFWRKKFNELLGKSPFKNNTIILSFSQLGLELNEVIKNNPQLGLRSFLIRENDNEIYLGINKVKELLEIEKIQSIVVDHQYYKNQNIVQFLYNLLPKKIELVNLDIFYEKIARKIPLSEISQLWFLENIARSKKNIYEIVKRFFDVIFSLILLIASSPLWAVIAFLIKWDSKGLVFYRQVRIGQYGKRFTIIKFRSMIEEAEKFGAQWSYQKDWRITEIGRFLRKTRLDELPQLLNIIKGEMSFIGPRAERPEFHERLMKEIPFYKERYLIKPGLSGWAQIKFHYGSSVGDALEKLQYDLYYIKNRSIALDLEIALKTISIVLKGGGV